jgi:hypothetical protein
MNQVQEQQELDGPIHMRSLAAIGERFGVSTGDHFA